MTESLGRGKVKITPDEVISLLDHSEWPTVIIEGKDDVVVFRRLENIYSEKNLSILPVGGRPNLLDIYRRTSRTEKSKHLIYICDRDVWC